LIFCDREAARLVTNQWVAAATRDRIKDLLHKEDITDKTRTVLINSIYWKGKWAAPFELGETKMAAFTDLNGTPTKAALMHQQAEFQIVERDGVKAVQLPYEGHEVSMIVLLPHSAFALPRLERRLTTQMIYKAGSPIWTPPRHATRT